MIFINCRKEYFILNLKLFQFFWDNECNTVLLLIIHDNLRSIMYYTAAAGLSSDHKSKAKHQPASIVPKVASQ